MKTSIKKLSNTKVILTITLDSEELAISEQVALTKMARDIKVAGFRKGKTPASVAAKNVDPNALQEQTVNDAISKAVATAFMDNKVQVLERPAVEVKKFVPGELLEFTAEAEVLPEVKLGNYKNLKLKSDKIAVSTAEINDTIEKIRQNLAERKDVTRAAKVNDETIIDFEGKRDEKIFDGGSAKDFHLKLGSKQFIPGFEEGIVGHKAGDQFDIKLTFPKDYHAKEMKGAKVVFSVNLKKVQEVVLPELDDKLAAKAGPFKNVTELKNDIKRELLAQKKRENDEKAKDGLIKQLVACSTVPVPDILVADQAKMIEQDFEKNLAYQGLTIDQYIENKGFKTKENWRKEEVIKVATERVQAGLVLAELSKKEKIEASTEELEARLSIFRQQYANNQDALKQFDLPEVQRNIANRLLTEKTVEKLVELNSKK